MSAPALMHAVTSSTVAFRKNFCFLHFPQSTTACAAVVFWIWSGDVGTFWGCGLRSASTGVVSTSLASSSADSADFAQPSPVVPRPPESTSPPSQSPSSSGSLSQSRPAPSPQPELLRISKEKLLRHREIVFFLQRHNPVHRLQAPLVVPLLDQHLGLPASMDNIQDPAQTSFKRTIQKPCDAIMTMQRLRRTPSEFTSQRAGERGLKPVLSG